MFGRRQGFTLVEVVIVTMISALLVMIALTLYNPREQSAHDAAATQLEGLKNAIILFNASHPDWDFKDENIDNQRGPLWYNLLPNYDGVELMDPWGNFYRHDYYRGCVYACGPNMKDDEADADDMVVFYRPPSAEIVERYPPPGTTLKVGAPPIYTKWRLGAKTSLVSAELYVDKKLVALTPPASALVISNNSATPYSTSTVGVTTGTVTLAEGVHQVQVKIVDEHGNARRTSWSFRIDSTPPKVYALNPIPGSQFENKNPLVSCLYHDASGVDLLSVNFDITTAGGSILGGARTYATINADRNFSLSSSGLSWRPGVSGITTCATPYNVTFAIADVAGNAAATPVTWSFKVIDTTAPQVQIQQPVFGSAITTDCDLDPFVAGTQIAVVGTTEARAKLSLRVLHDGAWGPTLLADADVSGYFTFPKVLVHDAVGATNIPTNVIEVTAKDAANQEGKAQTQVYLFNGSNRLKCSAWVTPGTTNPNQPVVFGVQATDGTLPYTFSWDFDDGLTREGVIDTAGTTVSVSHTYATTGEYTATVHVRDQLGLTATAAQIVYVGTESVVPTLYLAAVPKTVYCGIPGGGTKFHIRIGGKYLGDWRLHVQPSADLGGSPYLWYYVDKSKRPSGFCTTPPDVHAIPDKINPAQECLWVMADSNDFAIPWDGTDNDLRTPTFPGNPQRKFPSNKMTGTFNLEHRAFLEYRDALGNMSYTSAPVIVYQGVPAPREMKIIGVRGQGLLSPQLYDKNLDQKPDFTNSDKVDLMVQTPESSNPTDVWLSNYPLELHKLLPAVGTAPDLFTTYTYQIVPDGEVFYNWTPAAGVNYSAVDGSSGWIPLGDPNPGQPNQYFDWPIIAWPRDQVLPALGSNADRLNYSRPWNYSVAAWLAQPLAGAAHSQAAAHDNPGLDMSWDGWKSIYAIYQDANVFTSTQKPSSALASDGVSSCSIILDRTAPKPASPPKFTNVEVRGNWADLQSLSVWATISVTAEDFSDTGHGSLWGSGLTPNGQVIVTGSGGLQRQIQYQSLVDYEFGPMYLPGGASNLGSIAPNSTLTATVNYRDNLANRSVATSVTSSMWKATATISKYTWTVIGRGTLAYYVKNLSSGELNLMTEDDLSPTVIPEHTDAPPSGSQYLKVNANIPRLEHWIRNGAKLGPPTLNSTVLYEDKVPWMKGDISPAHFPDPYDRVALLQARRPAPPYPVEQEASFIVDDAHYYYLVMVKGEAYVEYRVYEGLPADHAAVQSRLDDIYVQSPPPATTPSGSAAVEWIVNHPAQYRLVAMVDRVALTNFNPARVNEGYVSIPREASVPVGNELSPGRDLHVNYSAPGEVFSSGAAYRWDRVTDLLISDSVTGTTEETYPYRGILFDYDGGTVKNVSYKVTANSFAVRAGFVSTAAAPVTTNRNVADNTYAPSNVHWLVKAKLVPQATGLPTSKGFGTWTTHTFIEDYANGYPPLPAGQVSGTDFRIRYSDFSTDFNWMTTGTVWPYAFVFFQASSSAGLVETNTVRIIGGVPAAYDKAYFESQNYKRLPRVEDLRGDTACRSHVIDWPILNGAEGTLKAMIWYQDEEGNTLNCTTVSATVDSKPPQITGPLRIYSYPGARAYSNSGPTWLSTGGRAWTSSTYFQVDYSGVPENPLWREFNAATPAQVGVGAAYKGKPALSSALFDIYGDAHPVTVAPAGGNPARWWAVPPSKVESAIWLGPAVQGKNSLWLRFRDAAYNVSKVLTVVPDAGQSVEPTWETSIYRDTTPPTSFTTIAYTRLTDGKTVRTAYGIDWTNDTALEYTWGSHEVAPPIENPLYNSGIVGWNVGVDQTGAVTNPPNSYPPLVMIEGAPAMNITTTASSTSHPAAIAALSGDGRKRFAVEAVDLVNNVEASAVSTYFNYDSMGPVVQTANLIFRHQEYVSPNHIAKYNGNNGGWSATRLLDWTASEQINTVRFTATKGRVAIKTATLKNGATVKWGPVSPRHPQETYRYPTSGHVHRDADDGTFNDRECIFTDTLMYFKKITFGEDHGDSDEGYYIDDLSTRRGATVLDTFQAEGTNSALIRGGTVVWGPFDSGPADRVHYDWNDDDDGHDSGFWYALDYESITLAEGQSFDMSLPVTWATRLEWMDWDLTSYFVKTYVSNPANSNLPIADNSTVNSIIHVPDNPWEVHNVRIWVDIAHTYKGDVELKLFAPDGSTHPDGRLKCSDGDKSDNIQGWFDGDFAWDSCPYHSYRTKWKNDVGYNAGSGSGDWKLEIKDIAKNDTGTLKSWKLEITGKAVADPVGEYTAQVLGPGSWAGWSGWSNPPIGIVTNAAKIWFQWSELNEGTTVMDPGYDGTANGTGIGSANNDLEVPMEWGYVVDVGATEGTWGTTSTPERIITPPTGSITFKLGAYDLLGNRGPAQPLLTILADAFPPTLPGPITATRNNNVDVGTPVAPETHASCITTRTVVYHVGVDDPDSGVKSYCYTINAGSALVPNPSVHHVYTLGTAMTSGTLHITVDDLNAWASQKLIQGQDIYFTVRVADSAGTWSAGNLQKVITRIDWTPPAFGVADLVDPVDGNPLLAGIQMARTTHWTGANYDLQGQLTDNSSGIETVNIQLIKNGVNQGNLAASSAVPALGQGVLATTWHWLWPTPVSVDDNDPTNLTGGCLYTVRVTAKDWCGNTFVAVVPGTDLRVDTVAPAGLTAFSVPIPANEPDLASGTKAEANSFLCIYNWANATPVNPPLRLMAVPLANFAGVNIGASPMHTDGFVYARERDAAGNFSAGFRSFDINTNPGLSIALAGPLANAGAFVGNCYTITLTITDPDTPDIGTLTLSGLEWQADNETLTPLGLYMWRIMNPASIDQAFPWAGRSAASYTVNWDSDLFNLLANGANALDDTAVTRLQVHAAVTDSHTGTSGVVASNDCNITNNSTPTLANYTRTPLGGIVRGDLTFSVDVADLDLTDPTLPPWDQVTVTLEYNNGSWQTVPNTLSDFNATLPVITSGAAGTGFTFTWKSANIFNNVDYLGLQVRIRATDRQGTTVVTAIDTFDLKNVNNPPTITLNAPGGWQTGPNVVMTVDIDDPNWNIPGELLSINGFEYDVGSGVVNDLANCSFAPGQNNIVGPGPQTITITWNANALLNGRYKDPTILHVRVRDAIGSAVWSANQNIQLDLNDQPTNVITGPGGTVGNGTIQVAFTPTDADDVTWPTIKLEWSKISNTGPWTPASVTDAGVSPFDWTSADTDLGTCYVGSAWVQLQLTDDSGEAAGPWTPLGYPLTIDNNQNATITAAPTASDAAGPGNVDVTFGITDGVGEGAVEDYEVQAQFSLNGGGLWTPCAQGISNFLPQGPGQHFYWNPSADATAKGKYIPGNAQVQLQVRDSQLAWSALVATANFTLDDNTDPTITLNATPVEPAGKLAWTVPLNVTITDVDQTLPTPQQYTVRLYWQKMPTVYGTATGNTTIGPLPAAGPWEWDSRNAYPVGAQASGPVQIKLEVKDNSTDPNQGGAGGYSPQTGWSPSFFVDNEPLFPDV